MQILKNRWEISTLNVLIGFILVWEYFRVALSQQENFQLNYIVIFFSYLFHYFFKSYFNNLVISNGNVWKTIKGERVKINARTRNLNFPCINNAFYILNIKHKK